MILTLKLLIASLTLIFSGNSSGTQPFTVAGEGADASGTDYTGLPPYRESSLLFDRLGLDDEQLNFEAFDLAYTGYRKIKERDKEILTLIDYSRSSAVERLFVIDMENEQVLYRTHVAHGRNSGEEYAVSFSNVKGSYKSSPGFFLTDETYHGQAGYSLRLEGLEKGINDKARQRAIVMHPSKYADPSMAARRGMLGRSLGCPAIPPKVSREIIDTIKEGSVLFIYPGQDTYASLSPLLSRSDMT